MKSLTARRIKQKVLNFELDFMVLSLAKLLNYTNFDHNALFIYVFIHSFKM